MQKNLKKTDYEELGKLIETVYETGYMNRGRMLKMSFLKGVATGVGGVIGATLVIATIAWILSLLSDIPFLGDITDNVQETIQKNPE